MVQPENLKKERKKETLNVLWDGIPVGICYIKKSIASPEEGKIREFGVNMYILLCLKWITSKDLLHSTWNSAQCYVAAWMGGGFGGDGYMCVYG